MDEVLLGKAAIIERCVKRLHEDYLGYEDELATNFLRQDAIVLNLQRACEASIDAAMHLVRIHRLGIPTESRQGFELLVKAGLLDAELGKKLVTMVGFRNVAVHNYQELDIDILRSILAHRLADLQTFARMLIGRGLPRQDGFTMIELIIVMILTGILAVVAIGRMDFTDTFAQRALSDRLMASVQFARKAAVASRRYVCVNVAGNQAVFTIDNNAPDGLAPADVACETALNLPAPDRDCAGVANRVCAAAGMTLAVTGGAVPFLFDPNGRAQNQVVLTTSGNYTVTIEAETGYVHH